VQRAGGRAGLACRVVAARGSVPDTPRCSVARARVPERVLLVGGVFAGRAPGFVVYVIPPLIRRDCGFVGFFMFFLVLGDWFFMIVAIGRLIAALFCQTLAAREGP
jgi:hypothetical protein